VDSQVPDSACTATAYLCGIKNNKATIGVTSKVRLSDCPASVSEGNRITSIMQWAQWAGKATGIVTTTRVTHASPAGAFAHIPHRDWESDADMANLTDAGRCEDIAKQLVTRSPGKDIKASSLHHESFRDARSPPNSITVTTLIRTAVPDFQRKTKLTRVKNKPYSCRIVNSFNFPYRLIACSGEHLFFLKRL